MPGQNVERRASVDSPVVTVIVLNYNYGRWVIECLDSVRDQTYDDIELIVIDDGSTDGSRDVIRQWIAEHWPSAVCRLHDENRGLLVRANEGLGLVRTPYYQLFSTDDRMAPEKVEAQVAVLDNNAGAALCYSDMWLMDGEGKLRPETEMHRSRVAGHPPRSGRVLDRVFTGWEFAAPSWLVRRDAVVAVGGYEPRIYTEDIPLLFRLGSRYDLEYIDQPLVYHRRHGGNLSSRFESTPEHRLAWCELLLEVEDQPEVKTEWLREYHRRVRSLMVGNSRRESLPHVRYLARKDPSVRHLALRGATEVGLCGSRARRLMAWRDSIKARLQDRQGRGGSAIAA